MNMFSFWNKVKEYNLFDEIEKIYNKIDKTDIKAFGILFLIAFIVFSPSFYSMLFGNHDWDLMFQNINPKESLFVGRYSCTWLEYILCNKVHIPFYVNLLSYVFFPLYIIFSFRFFKVPRKLFSYILAGCFIITTPFIFSIYYYRIITFSSALLPLLVVISLYLCEKTNDNNSIFRKIIYFIAALTIMTVFVVSSYHPIFVMILIYILAKILIDYIDTNNKNSIFKIICSKKYSIITLLLSMFINFIIFQLLAMNNIINENMYNAHLISIKELLPELIFYIKNIFNYALLNTFPYVSIQYRIMSFAIYLLAIISACTHIIISDAAAKTKVQRLFTVILLFISLFFVSEIIYFISPLKSQLFRLEFISSIQLFFIGILICYKYSVTYIKNFLLILLICLINIGTMSIFGLQKDLITVKKYEEQVQNLIINKIINIPNFDKNIEYEYVQIGQYTSFAENIYSSNEYSENDSELLYNFITKFNNSLYIKQFGRITNLFYIACDDYDSDNIELLEKKMDKTVYDWIIKTADVFPNKNSIFIKDDKIYVVMSEEVFLNLKQDITDKQLSE